MRWSFGWRWRIRRGGTDGDVAFDVAGEKAVRVARESDHPLQVDGVHVRRMLMMTNPVCSCERCSTPERVFRRFAAKGESPASM